MRNTLSVSIAVLVLRATVTPPAAALDSRDNLYLAEGFVAERESAAQRSFDKAYRERVGRRGAAVGRWRRRRPS